MTVRDLKILGDGYIKATALDHAYKLKQQKLGTRISYTDHSQIIDNIVLQNIIEANEPLLDTDTIRIPAWCTTASFTEFISKISYHATNNLS